VFQTVLRDDVPSSLYARAEKQAKAASQRILERIREQQDSKAKRGTHAADGQGTLDFEDAC
jgi:hypothetical protein